MAIRNAQLFARVEAQNTQLLELDAAKDDFLRGVSHNLQTPLTSIRAYAHQLQTDHPDRRLDIIAEQSERLSRMVRQLLTVTRLESGALHPRSEVVALGPRVKRAWEALAAADVALTVEDGSQGWLAIADVDQLDQVLWALLDNAVKYGTRSPIAVEVGLDEAAKRLRLTITDRGRAWPRPIGRACSAGSSGARRPARDEGTAAAGSGLYVSRELCRAMDGDLVLEPTAAGRGASFSVYLPGSRPRIARAPPLPRIARGNANAGRLRRPAFVFVWSRRRGAGASGGVRVRGQWARRSSAAAFGRQMIPRGSPAISAAAATPRIGPSAREIPEAWAIIAPAYQPQ